MDLKEVGVEPEIRDQAFGLVLEFFGWNWDRTELWFRMPNPLIGGLSPIAMILFGRADRLLAWIQTQIGENP